MAKFKSDLIKQAIAEADEIQKFAVESAKLSLEESFTPALKSMLARNLRAESEEADEDEKDVETENVDADKTTTKAVPRVDNPETPISVTSETADEKPHEDGEPEGSSEMPADSSTVATGDNKEPSDDASATSDIGDGPEAGDGENSNGWYEDWNENDFDLDEVISALEEEAMELEASMQESEHEEGDEADAPAEKKDEIEESDDEAKPEEKASKEPAAEEPAGEDEEELDIDALVRELDAEDSEEAAEEKPQMGAHQMAQELGRIKNELAEYRKAYEILRGKLQEVNLLNAKLMYTTKMFKKDNLTNEQKVAIVEAFDRAKTVREAKIVYAVLVETLTTAAKAVKATKPATKVVAEGLASKTTQTTARKPAEQEGVLTEEHSPVAKRFQELAGLLKS